MKGTQPDLGAVLVTRWDVHTDMRPRTFPELPAISGETKGPGSPDAGRAPSAAPGTIPSFTARSGGQGQRQCRPELTLQVPRPFRKIFILLDGNVSFFPCSKQTIQNILSLFLDDIIVIQSIRYCTLPPSGAPGAVARCWPLHALSPNCCALCVFTSFLSLSLFPSRLQAARHFCSPRTAWQSVQAPLPPPNSLLPIHGPGNLRNTPVRAVPRVRMNKPGSSVWSSCCLSGSFLPGFRAVFVIGVPVGKWPQNKRGVLHRLQEQKSLQLKSTSLEYQGVIRGHTLCLLGRPFILRGTLLSLHPLGPACPSQVR